MAEFDEKIQNLKGARLEAVINLRKRYRNKHVQKLVFFDIVAKWPLFDVDSTVINARKNNLLAAVVDFEKCTITVDKACTNEIPLQ